MNLVPYDDNNLPKKTDAENRKLPQVSRSLGKPVKNNNEKVVNNSSGKVVKSSSGKIVSGSSGKVAKNNDEKVVNCDSSSNYVSIRISNGGCENVVDCGDSSGNYNEKSENISEDNYNTNGGENEETGGCCGCIILIVLILFVFGICKRIGHVFFSVYKKDKPAVIRTIDKNVTTEKVFDKDFSNDY